MNLSCCLALRLTLPLLEGGPVHVDGVLVGEVDQAGPAVHGPCLLHAVGLQVLDVLRGKRKKRTRITAPPDAPTRAPSGRHIPLCRQRFEEASERHADGIRDRGRVTVMNAFEIRQIMID